MLRPLLYTALGLGLLGILALLLFPSLRFRLQPAKTVTPPPLLTGASPMPRGLKIITVLPRDAIPAILSPRFASPDEAETRLRLLPSTPLLGLSINGYHRAYPVAVLSRHEIVNDVLGGHPVAVTW